MALLMLSDPETAVGEFDVGWASSVGTFVAERVRPGADLLEIDRSQ